MVPDRLSRIPTRKGSYTEKSFLRDLSPAGYSRRWEEFFWQGRPFGFHLRNLGRWKPTRADDPELLSVLASAPLE